VVSNAALCGTKTAGLAPVKVQGPQRHVTKSLILLNLFSNVA
jgi:hypothetical protein